MGTGPARADVDADDVEVGQGPVFQPQLIEQGAGQYWYPGTRAGVGWTCPYGCPGIVFAADGLEAHVWNCPYWEREGRNETPFDLPSITNHQERTT